MDYQHCYIGDKTCIQFSLCSCLGGQFCDFGYAHILLCFYGLNANENLSVYFQEACSNVMLLKLLACGYEFLFSK